MSAGTRNLDFGSLFRTDRDEPTSPTRSRPNEKPDAERLRIVRAEESAFPTGESLEATAKSSAALRRPPTEYLAEEISVCPKLNCGAGVSPVQAAGTAAPQKYGTEAVLELKMLPTRKPGVDLAALQSCDSDAAELAAFLYACPAAKDGVRTAAQLSPGKAVVMPLANTDLQEIFQADKICMVARPRENASKPASDACSSISPQTSPQILDKTRQYLVDNWPKLPPNVQAAILNVIDVAIGPDDE
jgi:hypothetical protein